MQIHPNLHTQKFHKNTKLWTIIHKQRTCKGKRSPIKNLQNCPWVCFCWPIINGQSACPYVLPTSSLRLIDKSNFLFSCNYQLKANSGLGMEAVVHFTHSSGTPLRPYMQEPCAGHHSLCEFICAIYKTLFTWCPPFPWLSYFFCILFCSHP